MEDFEEIRNALRDDDRDGTDSTGMSSHRITVMGTDPMMNMQNQIIRLISENTDLIARMSALEAKVVSLIDVVSQGSDRSKVKVPTKELFTMTPTHAESQVDDSSSSIVDVARDRSVTPAKSRAPSESLNPFSEASRSTNASLSVFKSNSAIAPQGYVGKKSVWGTALASMLVGATRYYISKTNSDMMMIDERRLMKNCIMIMPTLYFAALHKDLPDVKNPATKYLSNAISRMDKNDVPTSDAETWMRMKQYQDGKDVVSVLETVIMIMKAIPEVVTHPVSQVVPMMIPPVVRSMNDNPIFAIGATHKATLAPNQWETWCSILKEGALVKYIKYRLAGMNEAQVVSKMVGEIRRSDLVEKKNQTMIDDIAPFTITHRSGIER